MVAAIGGEAGPAPAALNALNLNSYLARGFKDAILALVEPQPGTVSANDVLSLRHHSA